MEPGYAPGSRVLGMIQLGAALDLESSAERDDRHLVFIATES